MTDAFTLHTCEEMMEMPNADWLVEGYLSRGVLAEIFGPAKGYKSFIALDWAMSIANGVPWLGHETTKGDVIYIYGEGSRGAQGKRIKAWFQSHPLKGQPKGRMYTLARSIGMSLDAVREQLIETIAKYGLKPSAIIVDTVTRNFGPGDMDKTSDMSRFVSSCDKLRQQFPDMTILLVHHTGHGDKGRARNSPALDGALDTQFYIDGLDKKARRLKLKIKYQKDGDEDLDGLELQLEKVDVGGGESSLVVREVVGLATAALSVSNAELVARAVQQGYGDAGATKDEAIEASVSGKGGQPIERQAAVNVFKNGTLAKLHGVTQRDGRWFFTPVAKVA